MDLTAAFYFQCRDLGYRSEKKLAVSRGVEIYSQNTKSLLQCLENVENDIKAYLGQRSDQYLEEKEETFNQAEEDLKYSSLTSFLLESARKNVAEMKTLLENNSSYMMPRNKL